MYGAAIYGTTALGTPKPASVVSGFIIYLAGAPLAASLVIDQLEILSALDQRGTADLTVLDYTGATHLQPATRLDIVEGGAALFRGTIERVDEQVIPVNSGGVGGRATQAQVVAVDLSQIADRRLIVDRVDFAKDADHPSGWFAGDVVRTLVNCYLAGEGIVPTEVSPSSRVTAAFEAISVAEALTQIGEVTGDSWSVDANRALHFGPRTVAPAPFSLTDSTPLIENVRVRRSRERFRTEQTIRVVTAVESLGVDDAADFIAWTVGSFVSAPGFEPPKIQAFGTTDRFVLDRGTVVYRDLGLTIPTTVVFDYSHAAYQNQSGTVSVPSWITLFADGAGRGMALWFQETGSFTNQAVALTTTNCWSNVNTPTTTRSFEIDGQPVPSIISVTSALLTWVLSGTVVATIAPTLTPGGLFAITTGVVGSAGPFAFFDNLTYPVSGFAALTLTRSSAAATSSIQAREGGTGRYQAIETLPNQTNMTSQQILDRADGLLRRFGVVPDTLSFETEQAGLRAGQLLTVNLTMFGISDDYLVTEVQIRRDGTPATRYSVKAISDEQQGGSVAFFRDLAR